MAKTASNQLGICLRIMHVRPVPKVSIFMAVTTKIVPEKAQKWPKMARFWPKWRYNGRVMAREVFLDALASLDLKLSLSQSVSD